MGSTVPTAASDRGVLKQFYVAVGTEDAKLTTLVELLHALQADSRLALAICCSSRDSLDAAVCALKACPGFNLAVLHSDLTEEQLSQQVQAVKQQAHQHAEAAQVVTAGTSGSLSSSHRVDPPDRVAPAGPTAPTASHNSIANSNTVKGVNAGVLPSAPSQSLVLVATDVCFKALPKDLLPIALPLMVQLDIPQSKEVFKRRMASVFGGSKERRRGARSVVIDFVVAGELPAFRARERFSTHPIHEMPVHVPDIFL